MSDAVTILVPARDEEERIGATVTALRAAFPEAEVIVADDGSTDRTRELLLSLQEEFPNRITTIVNARNLGVFRNLNQVIWLASGDLVHLLAGDDWYEPGMFEAMNREVALRRLDPGTEAFMLVPSAFDFAEGRLTRRVASPVRVRRLFKSALRQQIQLFPVGISRALFRHYGEFQSDLGLWADYLQQLTYIQYCEAAYPLAGAYPVYRRGSGISSRVSSEELSRSFAAVVTRVRSECHEHLDRSDHRILEFMLRKHELIIKPDAVSCLRFVSAAVVNLFNGVKRTDVEIAASVLLRQLFPGRRPRRP